MNTLRSAAFLLVCAAFLPARAQMFRDGPPPATRLVYRSMNVVRWNPVGLQSENRLTYRWRLYEHDSLALRENFVSVGVVPVLSGGFVRGGILAEVQPATFLNLFALYEGVAYYGVANLNQSFPSATSAYDDATLKRLGQLPAGDPAKNYATTGTQLNFGATLMAKVREVALRAHGRLMRPSMKLRAGDRAFYDITNDLLVGNNGWSAMTDVDVVWQHEGLSAGLRWSTAKAFYDDAHFAPEDDRSRAPGTLQKAGPVFAYTWRRPDGARYEPTVLGMVQWWLANPSRTALVSQAVPCFVLGFQASGDLLTP